jgi:preprotein translocase SecF subunit
MFQILKDTKFPFMKYRKIAYTFSSVVVLATVSFLIVNRGPRWAVDFTGGTLLQVQTAKPLPADEVRDALSGAGLQGFELQALGEGNDLMVRLATADSADAYARVSAALTERFPDANPQLRRQETVGPKVGAELREKALLAVLLSMGAILIYIGIRYEFKFAIGSVLALFHSVFAAFAVVLFANREISLTVIAALLTIAGYSINDTIVVFDRIRERSKQLHKLSHEDMMNVSLNETLSRTLVTSIAVFLATMALYLFGGEVINDFALCMLAGLIFGTYSSIYIASALALDIWNALDRRKKTARAKAA